MGIVRFWHLRIVHWLYLAQFIFGIHGGYILTTLSLSTSTWLGRVVMGVDFPHTHGVILPTSAVLLIGSVSSGGNNVTT